MRSTRSIQLLGVAGIAALVLTGCSGGADSKKLTWEDSPLAEYLSAGFDTSMSQEDQEKELEKKNAEIEDKVAACMTEAGFEYTPQKNNGAVVFADDDEESAWNPDDKDWVAQWGYGIVDYPGRADQEADDAESKDDNQKFVDSLSESERSAYYKALMGQDPADTTAESEEVEYDWKTAGCYGSAQHEVYGDSPYDNEKYASLIDGVNALYTSTEATTADKNWAACMSKAGEPDFKMQSETYELISNEAGEILGWNDEEGAKMGETEESTAPDPTDDKSDPAKNPELKKLKDKEIALATKDLACREETGYEQQQMKDHFAKEEKFLAENKAELEEYKADSEAAAKKSKK